MAHRPNLGENGHHDRGHVPQSSRQSGKRKQVAAHSEPSSKHTRSEQHLSPPPRQSTSRTTLTHSKHTQRRRSSSSSSSGRSRSRAPRAPRQGDPCRRPLETADPPRSPGHWARVMRRIAHRANEEDDTSDSHQGSDHLSHPPVARNSQSDDERAHSPTLSELFEESLDVPAPIVSPPHSAPPSHDRLSDTRLVLFNRYAQNARLAPEFRLMALQASEAVGSADQFIAGTVFQAQMMQTNSLIVRSLQQEIDSMKALLGSTPAVSGKTFKITDNCREFARDAANRMVADHENEAYTATVNSRNIQITFCLENRVETHLKKQDPAWRREHLPPGYDMSSRSIPSSSDVKVITRMLKDLLKHARRDMSGILTTNVPKLKEKKRGASKGPLPILDVILLRLDAVRYPHKKGVTPDQVLASIPEEVRLRHAFLRFLAVEFSAHHQAVAETSFWAATDVKLEALYSPPHDAHFRFAFHMLVLELDKQFFNGTNTFEDVKEHPDFRLPNDDEVMTRMTALNLAHGL